MASAVSVAEDVVYVAVAVCTLSLLVSVATSRDRLPGDAVRVYRVGSVFLALSAPPSPVDFFRYEAHRWVALATFNASLLYVFLLATTVLAQSSDGGPEARLAQFFENMGYFLLVGVLFWPVFMCTRKIDRAGAQVAGALFSVALIVLYVLIVVESGGDPTAAWTAAVLYLPPALSGLVLLLFFARNAVWCATAAVAARRTDSPTSTHRPLPHLSSERRPSLQLALPTSKLHYELSVHRRLASSKASYGKGGAGGEGGARKSASSDVDDVRGRLRRAAAVSTWRERWAVVRDPHFQFPNRIAVALSLTSVLMAMMIVYVDYTIWVLAMASSGLVKAVIEFLEKNGFTVDDPQFWISRAAAYANVAVFLVPVLCVLMAGIQIVDVARQYCTDVLRLRRGDYGRVPRGRQHKLTIVDTVNFVGYQVGYALFGVVVMMLSTYIVITAVYWLLAVDSWRAWVWQTVVLPILVPFLVITIVFEVLRALLTYSFVIDRHQSPFDVRRRTIFAHVEYVFVFVNLMRGLVSYVVSRLLSPLIGVMFYSFRLDRSSGSGGLFTSDGGYDAYLGVLLADHYYCNPTVNVFVRLLSASAVVRASAADLVEPENVERAKTYLKLFDINPQTGKLGLLSGTSSFAASVYA